MDIMQMLCNKLLLSLIPGALLMDTMVLLLLKVTYSEERLKSALSVFAVLLCWLQITEGAERELAPDINFTQFIYIN